MANLERYNQRDMFGAQTTLSNLLGPEDLCSTIRDEIAPKIKDTDFEDMYKDGGRPPVSPRLLILVTIMQFLENSSDRLAAINLKFRLDWKIAFDVPVEFEGFHPSLLTVFRKRLLANNKATYAFDKVIEHLVDCGLLKDRKKKQRIDATHIIGHVQELSRIDLLIETLRLFCMDVVKYKEQMGEMLGSKVEHYLGDIVTRGVVGKEKERLISEAGQTMSAFLAWSELPNVPSEIKQIQSYKVLKKVYEQNFEEDDKPDGSDPSRKLQKVATGKNHICSPHEPEARYAKKGGKGWLGYKGEVVETVTGNKNEVNFITSIEINEATDYDGNSLEDVVSELQKKGIKPEKMYGDTHYNSTANIDALEKDGIAMEGPVATKGKRKEKKQQGFIQDLENEKVICPEGIESKKFNFWEPDKIHAVFPKNKCSKCPRRSKCKPEPRGKIYEARIPNKTLQKRRQKMKNAEYKKELHNRNGIEGTISGLVRGQKWRRSRYRGRAKTSLQAKFTGAAANIVRLHRERQIEARKKAS